MQSPNSSSGPSDSRSPLSKAGNSEQQPKKALAKVSAQPGKEAISSQGTQQRHSNDEQMALEKAGKDGSHMTAQASQQELPASQGQNSASGSPKRQPGLQDTQAVPNIIPDSQSPASYTLPSKSPAGSEKFYSPASGTSSANRPHLSQEAELSTKIVPDSSEEVKKSNKSPQGAELQSPPESSQPRLTVEALPRVLPKEITDTSDEVQRSNEDPKNATLRSQSTRKWEPTQPQGQAPEQVAAARPDRESPSASLDGGQKDSTNRASAVSKSASDLSAPVSSQWPLLNEEGIQHGSGSHARLRSSSPDSHKSIPPTSSEEAKPPSPSSGRSLKQSSPLEDDSQPAAEPIKSTVQSEGEGAPAAELQTGNQSAAVEGSQATNGVRNPGGSETSKHQQAGQETKLGEDASDPFQLQIEPLPEDKQPPEEILMEQHDLISQEGQVGQGLPQGSAGPLLANQQGLNSTDQRLATPLNKSFQQEEHEGKPAAASSQPGSQSGRALIPPLPPSIQALDLARTPFAIRTVNTCPASLPCSVNMTSRRAVEANMQSRRII